MIFVKSLLVAAFCICIHIFSSLEMYSVDASMIASVDLYKPPNYTHLGQINFTQDEKTNIVRVTGKLTEVPSENPRLGLHVHPYGTIQLNCASVGLHYNPTNVTHGAPWDSVRHVGDLGNINRTEEGTYVINVTDSIIKLTGPQSIVGRSLVLHVGIDDYGHNESSKQSKINGNAGARMACGVIGIVSDFNVCSGSG